MKYFSQSMTLMGTVTNVNPSSASFTLRCRSGDSFIIQASSTTYFSVLRNLDDLNRDRVPDPANFDLNSVYDAVRKYIQTDTLIVVQGIYIEHDEQRRFDARTVILMH
ncbi:MAG: N-acyl-D-glucosamine 2-epimerase, partial [Candidatus Competibacteraceae bacterium]|nr:N-acyl-D-glucosamine 2-epimerase [Candidatus Competibacteraceae bacterium]